MEYATFARKRYLVYFIVVSAFFTAFIPWGGAEQSTATSVETDRSVPSPHPGAAQNESPTPWKTPPPAVPSERLIREEIPFSRTSPRIEATIVNPFRKAEVPAEIPGVISVLNFEEGDLVKEGQIVMELDSKQYQLDFEKAREKLAALEIAAEIAQKELKTQEELYGLDSTSLQDLLRKQGEANLAMSRAKEARAEFELAELNLKRCKIRAPFTGFIALIHKQPFEATRNLESLFYMVDSAKVFTIANVPEERMHEFTKGVKTVFWPRTGGEFKGTVDRVGKVIDPKSKTKRVWVLIPNENQALEVGMTGSLEVSK
ncbi:efflux RND transporter periplasmic adaptor subunit [Desulfomonile tiedjei]|uniref:RND family efflux transporter, MFP subunit n=1 Tax=Desulfomonile tiedjei (strain ATCC 49306 / DSM 6799 / DCB-1) TaxID=706587 RepID=I4C9R5_DESTA|nr:efflux RND transporter periplasmic adaptor subunit [Desulfomonile tiedjei]AFM26306.1 RND family efflux transporter, MFP subunit [Desulfomonile tiedjei DSM 6799]